VLDPCQALARTGYDVAVLPVDGDGILTPGSVQEALAGRPALVSVMLANNEIGTMQPVAAVARACQDAGATLHCDAAQAVGRVPVRVADLGIDFLSLSAHKIYGPKGVGALYVRNRPTGAPILPLLHGGGQEGGLRPGTLNVPGIVGLGVACDLARQKLAAESIRIATLRDRLQTAISSLADGVLLNGHPTRRLPGNLNLSFPGVDGEALLLGLGGIALSTGSACLSSRKQPSHVLLALGRSSAQARGSLRFGLGRFTTAAEVDEVAARVVSAVARLQALAPTQSPASSR
jgi:cysteine desulfurase